MAHLIFCAVIGARSLSKAAKRQGTDKLAYRRKRIFRPPNSPNWFVQIRRHGVRHKLSLETSNPEAAASKARDLYAKVRANGWESVLAQYLPPLAPPAPDAVTVGRYIASAKASLYRSRT